MAGSNLTQHSLESAFWDGQPLPVAEISVRLQFGAPGYFGEVMRFTSASMLLVLWIEVAAKKKRGEVVDVALIAWALHKVGLGKVAEVWRSMASAAVSWPLDQTDPAFKAVCECARALRTGSPRPQHRFGDALEAIVQIRNHWAHLEIEGEPPEVALAVEQAVRRLLETHALLKRTRLVYTDKVVRIDKETYYVGLALSGRIATPFRRGDRQPAPMDLPQGHVLLIDRTTNEILLDLHPLVLFDKTNGDACLLLTELRSTRRGVVTPVWTHVAKGMLHKVAPEITAELAGLLPGILNSPGVAPTFEESPLVPVVATVGSTSPADTNPQRTRPSDGSPVPIAPVALAGGLVFALLICVAATGLVALTVGPSQEPLAASRLAPARAASVCEIGPPPTRAPSDIPRWLSGVDAQWAESLETFDARCIGYVRDAAVGGCSLGASRSLMPASRSGIPGVQAVAAAFDTRSTGGMFEVTVQSAATPADVEAAFATAFGPASESQGERRVWLIGGVRVGLAPARSSPAARLGWRATLVARYLPLSDTYYDDRPRYCPPD